MKIVYLAVFGFIALVVTQLGPFYFDNYRVDLILSNVKEEFNHQPAAMQNIQEITQAIAKRIDVENLDKNLLLQIKVTSNPKGILLNYHYEPRIHFFYNIDVVINFQQQVQIEKQ